jgi:hypothetical protein
MKPAQCASSAVLLNLSHSNRQIHNAVARNGFAGFQAGGWRQLDKHAGRRTLSEGSDRGQLACVDGEYERIILIHRRGSGFSINREFDPQSFDLPIGGIAAQFIVAGDD